MCFITPFVMSARAPKLSFLPCRDTLHVRTRCVLQGDSSVFSILLIFALFVIVIANKNYTNIVLNVTYMIY